MEGASGAGAACGVAGAAGGTGRLERLASQVLRTDRSEFRKERHTGCRTECWWLPGLGSERHTGLRWALPESAQALQVPERLPYTDQRLASEQPLRTGRRPVPECRSGRIVRLRPVACPGLGRSRCRLPDRRSVRRLDRSSWP